MTTLTLPELAKKMAGIDFTMHADPCRWPDRRPPDEQQR